MEQLNERVYTGAQVANMMNNVLLHFKKYLSVDQDSLQSIIDSEDAVFFKNTFDCPVVDETDSLEKASPEELHDEWADDPFLHPCGSERY